MYRVKDRLEGRDNTTRRPEPVELGIRVPWPQSCKRERPTRITGNGTGLLREARQKASRMAWRVAKSPRVSMAVERDAEREQNPRFLTSTRRTGNTAPKGLMRYNFLRRELPLRIPVCLVGPRSLLRVTRGGEERFCWRRMRSLRRTASRGAEIGVAQRGFFDAGASSAP